MDRFNLGRSVIQFEIHVMVRIWARPMHSRQLNRKTRKSYIWLISSSYFRRTVDLVTIGRRHKWKKKKKYEKFVFFFLRKKWWRQKARRVRQDEGEIEHPIWLLLSLITINSVQPAGKCCRRCRSVRTQTSVRVRACVTHRLHAIINQNLFIFIILSR